MLGDESEYDPRAWIVDASGNRRGVKRSELTGLDEYADAWVNGADYPEAQLFSGWQLVDDDHPIGGGRPGYRVIRKLIRTFVVPQTSIKFGNAILRFSTGKLELSEPRFPSALPAREAGSWLIPEQAVISDDGIRCTPNLQFHIDCHMEDVGPFAYMEMIRVLPDEAYPSYAEQLAAGRAGVAAVEAMLDFMCGPRLVGPVITEEVGEVFSDWHWNRQLGGRLLMAESQTAPSIVDGAALAEEISAGIGWLDERSEEEKTRLRVAAQWYWRADAEADPVLRYVYYWICVEALELKRSSDIKPIKLATARITGLDLGAVTHTVGIIYSIRGKLVHGKLREVPTGPLLCLEALAAALLEDHCLGRVSNVRKKSLITAMGRP